MASKVKPLKIDDDDQAVPIPEEFSSTDYVDVKGVAFDSNDNRLLDTDGSGNIQFKDTTQTSYRALSDIGGQADAARFTITLLHSSTIQDGTFYGYSATIPGDTTPVIVPINCTFIEYTWSNSQATADFTLDFRKNSTVATPFRTDTYTDTQTTNVSGISQSFSAGDTIYIEHTKDNDNAANVSLVLFFQAVP